MRPRHMCLGEGYKIDRREFAAIFGIAYFSLLKPDLGKAFLRRE
jgi:hypothetical protein